MQDENRMRIGEMPIQGEVIAMTMLPKLRRSTDKYLTDAASGIAGLQARIIALEANQRTPGTVEVCQKFVSGQCQYYHNPESCNATTCPLRSQRQEG